MMDAVLLACVLGAIAIALTIYLGAVVAWMRSRLNVKR
jgi:hypothetical protein